MSGNPPNNPQGHHPPYAPYYYGNPPVNPGGYYDPRYYAHPPPGPGYNAVSPNDYVMYDLFVLKTSFICHSNLHIRLLMGLVLITLPQLAMLRDMALQ